MDIHHCSMLMRDVLSAYRAERAPIVVLIERIDNTIIHLLRSNLADLDIAAITRSDIATYRTAREVAGVQPSTVRRELVTLRAAANLAWREGWIRRVPPIPMPPRGRSRERVLNSVEISKLLAAARRIGPRCEVFLRLLLATGGRAAAIIELEWSRIDIAQKIIDLRSGSPLARRMKHRAMVPITASVAEYLIEYRNRPANPSTRGRPPRQPPTRVVGLSIGAARQQLAAAAAAAGIEGVTPHVIRHTVATHLLRHVPLVIASRMLGHKSVAITADQYGHLLTQDLEPAAAALDLLIKQPAPVTGHPMTSTEIGPGTRATPRRTWRMRLPARPKLRISLRRFGA